MASPVTPKQVHAAADELDAQGIRPTLAAVRKKIGRGSYTTISDAMSSWRAAAAAAQTTPVPVPEAVGDRMETFAQQVWAAAMKAADDQFTAQRDELAAERTELVATRDEAVTLADTVTAELDQYKSETAARLAELAGEVEQARAEVDDVRALADQHRTEAEKARVNAAELKGLLTALGAERDRLAADLSAAQQEIGRLSAASDDQEHE